MLAAEELDMDMSQLIFARHDTNITPEHGRHVRQHVDLERRAADPQRGRDREAGSARAWRRRTSASRCRGLSVSKGVVSGGGKTVTYGALIGDKLFNLPMAQSINPGVAPSKAVSAYSLVGLAKVPRVDIPAKVTGTYTYVHSVRVPGMLHARIVRPRGQGSYGGGSATNILSVDANSVAHLPGVKVLRRNDFLAVVAPKEYDAIQAAAILKVTYGDPPTLPSSGNLYERDAGPGHGRPGAGPDRGEHRQHRYRLRRRPRTRWPRPTSTSTTATCRSARPARSRT